MIVAAFACAGRPALKVDQRKAHICFQETRIQKLTCFDSESVRDVYVDVFSSAVLVGPRGVRD